ncbi:ADP/ATP translocase 4 isoform X2 [Osmia lignaria lignaria]|uniref:ADP/ATP translocase 4 isoform X2 n=1 Tax=Osmia lignaria lignaria TaxID=1437193 RepID=UPI0014791F74|nr:ADP/ATP translocase 4-like isoform X2 [Osmia lignaria]XP_034176796.1 ADP/ATP translocase 4-like isoform X2 [Osmia lignaria]
MKESKNVINDGSQTDLTNQYSRLSAAADFGFSFAISGLLAMVFKTIVAPLERVKLILQTQSSSRQIGTAKRTAYSGFLDALVRIPKEQGFLSLWRGNLLSICRYFPAQAINFSCYDIYYNALLQIIQPWTAYSHNLLPFLSGGAVGVTTCILLFPLNFCNTRISVDLGDDKSVKREFLNLRDCLGKVYKNDGVRGFYEGMSLMASGMFIYRAAYFGIYTISKRIYLNANSSDSTVQTMRTPFLVSLALAELSSFTGTMISYPLETIARQKMLWSGHGLKSYVTTRQMRGYR